MIKRPVILITLTVLSSVLASCVSQPTITKVGEGTVESEIQTISKSDIEKHSAKIAAEQGAAIGVVGGAGVGAVYGSLFGAICSVITLGVGTVPCFVAGIGGGAVAGGTVGGVGGAIVGGGSNYIYVANKDDLIGEYRYHVIQDGKTTPLVFEELPEHHFKPGTKVLIYSSEYNGVTSYFIKSKENPKGLGK